MRRVVQIDSSENARFAVVGRGSLTHQTAFTDWPQAAPNSLVSSGWGGMRGPHRSPRPRHPGPGAHREVPRESSTDCGGEGAERAEYRHSTNAPSKVSKGTQPRPSGPLALVYRLASECDFCASVRCLCNLFSSMVSGVLLLEKKPSRRLIRPRSSRSLNNCCDPSKRSHRPCKHVDINNKLCYISGSDVTGYHFFSTYIDYQEGGKSNQQ